MTYDLPPTLTLTIIPDYCRSCGANLPTDVPFAYLPDHDHRSVLREPCCPRCKNMLWCAVRLWMCRTRRLVEEAYA
jgi:hypothetical protein